MWNTTLLHIVSVGMPVYNGEKHIHEALESLLDQTFTNFELIISDNASTDSTGEICLKYVAKDSRIRYVRQPANMGPAANFNFLLQEAKGEYFMWAASDDRWDKKFIKMLFDAIQSSESCVGAFCPYVYTDEDGNVIGKINAFNYSSRFKVIRLMKLCWHYNDGFFYGLYKRESIKGVNVANWWWVNSATAVNCAYPVLFYLLSAGNLVLSEGPPLWFNRLYALDNNARYAISSMGNKMNRYLAFVLRKLNVLCFSSANVLQGSKSFLIAALLFPLLFMRFLLDCVMPLIRIGFIRLKIF